MTMKATAPPRTTMISGSIRLIMLATRTSTSSSKLSATLTSILSSSPVSSPTSIMLTTTSSTTPEARKGSAMVSPSRMESCTFPMARATTSLPVVSRTMLRASRIGTPEAMRVPSVRAKLLIVDLLTMAPNTGRCSLTLSTKYLPPRFRFSIFTKR